MEIPRHTFPTTHRLRGKLLFAAVYDAKTKETKGPLVVYSLPNDLGHVRMGISISRRVGIAVRRNRIKRLLREAFRAHQSDLPKGYDLIIVVRPHEPLMLVDYQKLIAGLMLQSHERWEKRKA